MKNFKNHQALSSNQLREIIGSKTLTGVEGGDIVECNASCVTDDDIGEIVVLAGDSIDNRSTASIEFGGASFAVWHVENTGFDGEDALYSAIDDI